MSNTMLMLGKGGFGVQLAEWLLGAGFCDELLFLDDNAPGCAGKLRDYPDPVLRHRCAAAFVGLGSNTLRLELVHKLAKMGYQLPVFCHPAAIVSPSSLLGQGTVVGPLAVVGAGVRAGEGCLINAGAIVDHNAILGQGVHVAPGAIVKAGAVVEDFAKIESGRIVFPAQ